MIDVRQLRFTYRNSHAPAVQGLNFNVERGEIFGCLGPSGAGKSTTQRILVGLLNGYSGQASVNGKEAASWQAQDYERIGVSPSRLLRIFSSYWPLKVYWLFDSGAIGLALVYGILGLAWQAALLTLLLRRFAQVIRR